RRQQSRCDAGQDPGRIGQARHGARDPAVCPAIRPARRQRQDQSGSAESGTADALAHCGIDLTGRQFHCASKGMTAGVPSPAPAKLLREKPRVPAFSGEIVSLYTNFPICIILNWTIESGQTTRTDRGERHMTSATATHTSPGPKHNIEAMREEYYQ